MLKAALCALATLISAQAAPQFDVLIRNARVIDGSGNPWFRADIGIKEGRIAAIGRLSDSKGYREIDAAGKVAAPGFIDVHTHIESGIEKVPRADNYILDGVTTVVTGNCGGSRLNLSEWFGHLEKTGIGLNVATLIGHNTVRQEIMGTQNRPATPEEIARMQSLVEKAMVEGAVGFSTGLIYIPGTYSNTEEVAALAKAASRYGGTYASHMRDEGTKILEAITEAVTVGRTAGMPVQLSHFKIDNNRLWGSSDKSIALVEEFRQEGVDVVVDQYPYEWSSTNLGITLPSWALADGEDRIRQRLEDRETRAKIVHDMLARLSDLGRTDYSGAAVASYGADHTLDGKTISEINVLKGRPKTKESEAETILEMIANGGAQMVYHSMGSADVERILRYPNTAIASDGGITQFGVGVPHPRAYGTNARVLAEFVRTRGVITLEDAIRRMTSLPARTFGFQDRGLLREGYAADLVLFDPAAVKDNATFPAPHQYTTGFDFVVINGKIAVENSKALDVLAGRVLRRR